MIIHAKLTGFKVQGDHTHIELVVENRHMRNLYKYSGNGKANVEIHLDDGRHITNDQRKLIFATLRDISDKTGYPLKELQQMLMMIHAVNHNIEFFSLSNCSIDTAKAFINTILEFALQMDIPMAEIALKRTDDVATWLMLAYSYEVCCICGKQGEGHHLDAIGMGRDRSKVYANELDAESKVIMLCREHHSEAETIGKDSFCRKYHVFGIKKKHLKQS